MDNTVSEIKQLSVKIHCCLSGSTGFHCLQCRNTLSSTLGLNCEWFKLLLRVCPSVSPPPLSALFFMIMFYCNDITLSSFTVAAIFTVMCYNVLCDKYCTRQQYGYCPSWGLNWEYRKKGIMDEIRTCAADIIGLQVRF